MTIADWTTQTYGVIQSLLFNNRHRVIRYLVRDAEGNARERSELPAPVRRLYETEAAPERTCLQTIQFVHHMLLPPGGRHVAELHIHPDAEELVVVTRGTGTAIINGHSQPVATGSVVYIAPNDEHEIRNTGTDLLGVLLSTSPPAKASHVSTQPGRAATSPADLASRRRASGTR